MGLISDSTSQLTGERLLCSNPEPGREDTQSVFAAMERAHQRGVKVRVLFDHLGSRSYPDFKKMRKWFTEVGIEYHLSLPLHFFGSKYTRFDLRNHRKIVVIELRQTTSVSLSQ